MSEREIDTERILAEIDHELAGFNAGLQTLEQKRAEVLGELREDLEKAALEKARKVLE